MHNYRPANDDKHPFSYTTSAFGTAVEVLLTLLVIVGAIGYAGLSAYRALGDKFAELPWLF